MFKCGHFGKAICSKAKLSQLKFKTKNVVIIITGR